MSKEQGGDAAADGDKALQVQRKKTTTANTLAVPQVCLSLHSQLQLLGGVALATNKDREIRGLLNTEVRGKREREKVRKLRDKSFFLLESIGKDLARPKRGDEIESRDRQAEP